MSYQNELNNFIQKVGSSELNNELKGLLQYGRSVRVKEYTHSVYNLLFVLSDVRLKTLKKLSKLIDDEEQITIEPFILTETEIESAADVYPIKFLDISQNHKLLLGKDPFDAIEVCQDNLRLRSEQELRNIALRLRYTFTTKNGSLAKVKTELKKSLYPLMNNLEVILILKTKQVVTNYDELLKIVKKDLNIDTGIVEELLKWSADKEEISDEAFLDFYEKYRALLSDLIHQIDQH